MFKNLRNRIPSSSEDGFSLMEIMLVFAIIAVLSSISMPAMRGFAASRRLTTSAHAIADTLAFARDMAITERTTHLVVFDVSSNRYWLASSETFDTQNPIASAGRTASPTTSAGGQVMVSRTGGIMGIPQPLNQGVTIAALVTTHNGVIQQITSGADYVYFSPTSTSVDTIVYLRNVKGTVLAVVVEASTGRASIEQMTPEQIQTLGLGNDL
ncbi:MAG: prepilin-type N-terminal cleavage/methylation domain-containing protein [Candidatus Poribacteria bacterium]|nr:prepilin-type N-terminal cleavage/methylation domain-containing protein [Candidatus Poribacteria bacterium]